MLTAAAAAVLLTSGLVGSASASGPLITGGGDYAAGPTLDGRTSFSLLDGTNAIDGTGLLTEWRYVAAAPGTVYLKVYRHVGTTYTVLARTGPFVATSTGPSGWLALRPPIPVTAGDFVGFETAAGAVIPFTNTGTIYAADLTHRTLFTDSASNATTGTELFTGSGDRTYAFTVRGSSVYTYFGGNAGPNVTDKKVPSYAFDGFAAMYGTGPGETYGWVTINYRAMKTSVTFTPGTDGTFDNGLDYYGDTVTSLRMWSNSAVAGAKASLQVREASEAAPRGSVAVFSLPPASPSYSVLNEASGWYGWYPLDTGNVHVVE
jgi:hypothetical protein